jgi:hypothetical protein
MGVDPAGARPVSSALISAPVDELRLGARRVFAAIGGIVELAELTVSGARVGLAIGATAVDIALAVSGLGARLGRIRRPRTPMRLRVDGVDVPLDADALARCFPYATTHVVVVVPGDAGSRVWADADAGTTTVYVGHRTGRPVAESGRDLADLLTALVDGWPVPLRRITLVGQTTGGLVAQDAVRTAMVEGRGWLRELRAVVCLDTPSTADADLAALAPHCRQYFRTGAAPP